MASSKSERILTKERKKDGAIVKFNRKTGEFMVLTKKGIIKTYFKPKYGQKNRIKKAKKYFDDQ